MAGDLSESVRSELITRRERLKAAVAASTDQPELSVLLNEVDAALRRMDDRTYGLCEVCHDPIEPDRLAIDPLTRHCLDHLTPAEQRALDMDLELAKRIQRTMLPECRASYGSWDVCHHFDPAGHVGGDYCDIVAPAGMDGAIYLMLGDVTGKGVAASLLMASLHATFRSLIVPGTTLEALLDRANHLFCQSTMSTHFATLACCVATPSHELRIANAGHMPVLIARRGGVQSIGSTGLPLGMFCHSTYLTRTVALEPGEMALLYSDGVTETENEAGEDYGMERLEAHFGSLACGCRARADHVIDACVADVDRFRGSVPKRDDVTLMAIRRMS